MSEILDKKEFYEYTKELLDKAVEREGNKRDQVIFVITSGTIVLSVPAVLTLAEKTILIQTQLFFTAILVLILALAAIITNYFISLYDSRHHLDLLENLKQTGKFVPTKKYEKIVELINIVSVLLLFTGIIFLLLFVKNNIIGINQNQMDQEEKAVVVPVPTYATPTVDTEDENI